MMQSARWSMWVDQSGNEDLLRLKTVKVTTANEASFRECVDNLSVRGVTLHPPPSNHPLQQQAPSQILRKPSYIMLDSCPSTDGLFLIRWGAVSSSKLLRRAPRSELLCGLPADLDQPQYSKRNGKTLLVTCHLFMALEPRCKVRSPYSRDCTARGGGP